MSHWVLLGDVQFYRRTNALKYMNPRLPRIKQLDSVGDLQVSDGRENANVTITIINSGVMPHIAIPPPSGTLFDGPNAVFTGTLSEIRAGEVVAVTLEA